MRDSALAHELDLHCLHVTGAFHVDAADDLPLDSGTALLISPNEPSFWPHFTRSPEYLDKASDPLDRWSRRVLDGIAQRFDAVPLYPFGGPPYQPFYSWALRTGRAWASPIGFLVHETEGLFVSYRAALVVPWQMPILTARSPCITCFDQPCTSACPVGAFDAGYDVAACKSHLQQPAVVQDCMTQGCAARRACPIGQGKRLPEQAAFHMEHFL